MPHRVQFWTDTLARISSGRFERRCRIVHRFMTRSAHTEAPTEASAWALLLALRSRMSSGGPIAEGTGLGLDDRGALEERSAQPWVILRSSQRGWSRPDEENLHAS